MLKETKLWQVIQDLVNSFVDGGGNLLKGLLVLISRIDSSEYFLKST